MDEHRPTSGGAKGGRWLVEERWLTILKRSCEIAYWHR